MDISDHVKEVGEKLGSDYPRFTKQIIASVSKKIIDNVVSAPPPPTISDAVLEQITEKLIVGKKPNSRQTMLQHDCYNRMVERLDKRLSKTLNMPRGFVTNYISTPQQTERHLLIKSNRVLMKNIQYAAALEKHLLGLPVPTAKDRSTREIHYACQYVAACALFGKVIFPDYDNFLLSLTADCVFFDPDYLIKRVKGTNAISRYFLPFPASAFLIRLILFEFHHVGSLENDNSTPDKVPLFNFTSFAVKAFNDIFKDWTAETLKKCGFDNCDGIAPYDFGQAVKALSVLNQGSKDSGIGQYPPFMLSVLSRKIPSYSFGNDSLSTLIDGFSPVRKDYGPKPLNTAAIVIQNALLLNAIGEISAIREGLEQEGDTQDGRSEAEKLILSVIDDYSKRLDPHNHENLTFYGRHVISIINAPGVLSGKNAEISVLWSLLSTVSDLGKRIMELNDDDYASILGKMAEHYNSAKIVKSMNAFFESLHVETAGAFAIPDLHKIMRDNDIEIRTRPSLEPLVTLDIISRALNRLNPNNQLPMPLQTSRKLPDPEKHASYTLRHAVQLTFFTGLRINELIELTLDDIIDDVDLLLVVREGKTKNSERYIPLSLILPDSYLAEFREYLAYRQSLKIGDNILFLNSAFRKWGEQSLTKAIFDSFIKEGMPEFNFHLLRHAFACWFILVWFYAFFEDMVPTHTPFLKFDLFSKDYIRKIKLLFLGMAGNRKEQEQFSYGLQVLARLLGHGGPIISLEHYIHVVDWMFFLISKYYEPKALSIKEYQSADLMQVSIPSLPPELSGRGDKSASAILHAQRERVKEILPVLFGEEEA